MRPKFTVRDGEMIGGVALALLACLWASNTYFALRTHGVTGSDPYAYVQMAVDLVQHQTLLHTFPLARQIAQWNLPLWPAAPVGYRPPDPQTGQAATVWPPGYSVLLVIAYVTGGEAGLYLVSPLVALAALVVVWQLGLELLRAWPIERQLLTAGVTVLVLATSYRQVEGAVLPMADVAAQLLTLLAIYGALRAARPPARAAFGRWPGLILAAFSGLCLGAAFSVRYTQALVAISVAAILILFSSDPPGSSAKASPDALRKAGSPSRLGGWRVNCLLAGGGALLGALPVLVYHALAFGSPFKVGSAELALFGWQYIPSSAWSLAQELLRTNEFLYLTPFLVWGVVRLWLSFRRESVALLLWLGVLLAFHLPYAALRARDLLPEFPVLALWAGVGVSDFLRWVFAWRSEGDAVPAVRTDWPWPQPKPGSSKAPASAGRTLAASLGLLVTVALLGARLRLTVQLPLHPERFNTFGYLNAQQRSSFDTLKTLVPDGAIVAASLNSGAVSLYTGRETVRPGSWSQAEWLDFVQHALAQGRSVYVLDDGDEMHDPIQALAATAALSPVAELPLPFFHATGSSDNQNVELYRIGP